VYAIERVGVVGAKAIDHRGQRGAGGGGAARARQVVLIGALGSLDDEVVRHPASGAQRGTSDVERFVDRSHQVEGEDLLP
jgi:hypothetical protein